MRLILLLLSAAALFSQQLPNTVTATASLTQSVAAANTVFKVQFVEATLTSTVDSALAVIGSAGLNASHLSAVTVEISQGFVLTNYDFQLTVPTSEFAATRDKLIAIQRTLANSQTQGIGWSSLRAPSDEELAKALELALPELLNRVKQRAALLAQAMNATLGATVNLSAPAVTPDGPLLNVSLTATFAVQ